MTTVDEFDKWSTYFRMRRDENEKADWYAASIAHMIAQVNGNKTKVADHLLEFHDPTAHKPDSKEIWLSLFGLN